MDIGGTLEKSNISLGLFDFLSIHITSNMYNLSMLDDGRNYARGPPSFKKGKKRLVVEMNNLTQS